MWCRHRKVNNVGVLLEVKPNMKNIKVPQLTMM